ncbi:MAG: hypothetical protein JJT75_06320 [Opitutales bacterium]|nr:hypothetical protein [Opitutales bacterium]MCH8541271.1 hypothetical protein [Opitutales bacterium]
MSGPIKIISLHQREANERTWTPYFTRQVESLGDYTRYENIAEWSDGQKAEKIREADVLLTGWDASSVPAELSENPGRLRYICHIHGEIRRIISRELISSPILVSNWGPAPGPGVAEGAMTLLLSSLKMIPAHVTEKRAGQWQIKQKEWGGTLRNLRVGVYGMGVIGREVVKLLTPFGSCLKGFDPYAGNWPETVQRMASLNDLFAEIDALIVTAGLNEETRHSVAAEQLARLPDGGIVINVARGAIIDQNALLAEVRDGRLRAGLDVLDTDGKDWMEPDDADRQLPNLLLTGHSVSFSPWNHSLPGNENLLVPFQEICLENLRRFRDGEEPLYCFTPERYDLST